MTYQLWLRDQTAAGVVDQLADAACALASGVDRAACRAVIDLAFHTRIRQTTACGTAAACRPDGPMWDTGATPAGETCAWVDRDPQGLPAMLAAAVADLMRTAGVAERRALEPELTMAFRAIFAPLLFLNRRCGRAAVCEAEPVFPLRPVRHGGC